MKTGVSKKQAKGWWNQCVSCSEASMTTQIRSFGMEEPVYEQAMHAFSGGFMHSGNACGLLTGTAIAAGFLAKEHFHDEATKSEAALFTTIKLAEAHPELTGSVNCREITDVSLTNLSGRLSYLLQGKGNMCGRLHIKWAFEAHQLIEETFNKFKKSKSNHKCSNCAVETFKKLAPSMGMKIEDSVVVAGLAGGVGLLGNVCGSLAVGIFVLSTARYLGQDNQQRDSQIRGALQELSGSVNKGAVSQLSQDFKNKFGSDACLKIVGRKFENIEDHSNFIKEGGCQGVIDFVAEKIIV